MADRAGEPRPGVQLPPLDQPYLDPVARGAGDALAALVLAEEVWVHRRVGTPALLTEEIVRRQVSVDFAVPAALRSALLVGEGQAVVPVALLRKQILRNFDLRNEAEEAVSVLARDHTTLLAGAALLAQASDPVRDLAPELAGRLPRVVRAPAAPRGGPPRAGAPRPAARRRALAGRGARPRPAGGAGGRRGARPSRRGGAR